jgi:hypothetical protein
MRWLLILALCGCCWGATRYVAQTAGTFSGGTACNGQTAITPATFNSTTLSAGDTTYLCGTITGTANTTILTVSQNGTSGNPITIIWDTNAILESPYFKASANGVGCGGGISICGRSYIVLNGGTNGILENTANGDSLANQQDSAGIDAYTCTNCTVENLTIQNIYVHPQNGLSSPDQTQMNCIAFSGSGWTITGNTMSNVGWCLKEAYGNGDSGTTITNNNISLMDHGWMLATSSANSFTNAFFSGNQIHDTYNWDTSGCAYHHDGIHTFGTSGSTMSGINVYNNYFYGNWGTCPTGFIFVEGGGSSTPSHMLSSAWWNNVFLVATSGAIVNTNGWFDLASGDSGTQQVYNNTAIGSGASDNTLCVGLENLSGLSYKNNTISGCGDPVDISSTTITATATNFYGAATCTNSGNCFIWNGSFTGSFSAWKTACSCDSTSIENLTALLNSNGSPQAGSPVIAAGTNLSSVATGNLASLLNDTSLGNTRIPVPRGTTWDIGAFQATPVSYTYGPPNYAGSPSTNPTANYIVPAPATPNVSTACTVGTLNTNCRSYSLGAKTVFTDSSYLTWMGFADLNTATICTGPLSAQDHLNVNWTAGKGGSSLIPLVNHNSTLAGLETTSGEYITIIKNGFCVAPTYQVSGEPAGGPHDVANNSACGVTTECSILITQAMNLSNPGSNSTSFNFGAPFMDLQDPSVAWIYGTNTQNTTSNLWVNKAIFGGTNQHTASFVPDGSFTLATTPTVDFQYALPVTYAPVYSTSPAAVAAGDYTIHQLIAPPSANAEFLQYAPLTAYNAGDITVPGTNGDGVTTNPGACMYKVLVGGTTGSSAPNFGSINPCQTHAVTDGTVKWQNLSSTAQFLYENTGTAGTTSGSSAQWILTPATLASTCSITSGSVTLTCPSSTFAAADDGQAVSVSGAGAAGATLYGIITALSGTTTATLSGPAVTSVTSSATVSLTGHPNLLGFHNDSGGIKWTNVGPAYVPISAGAWDDASGVSYDQSTFAMAMSTNSYGPWTKGGDDYLSQTAAQQNTGQWMTVCKVADPVSGNPACYVLDMITGWQSNVTGCASLSNCSGGTLTAIGVMNADINPCPTGSAGFSPCPSTPPQPNCASSVHNEKLSPSGNFVFLTGFFNFYDGANGTTYCSLVENFYGWLPNGINNNNVFDANVNFQIAASGLPHFAVGASHTYGFHNGGQGQNSGVMTAAYTNTNLSGNGGGLPPGCGNGSGQFACITLSGAAQPYFNIPYTFSIAGQSTGNTVTNNNYLTNGIAQTVYGTLNPLVSYNCSNSSGTCPGLPNDDLFPSWDQHFDPSYNPGFTDTGWLIGVSNTLEPTIAVSVPWQNQLMAFPMVNCATSTTGTPPNLNGCPGTTPFGTAKLFFHSFSCVNSPFFSTNVPISETGQDGTVSLFGTDFCGQFGSTGPLPGSTTGQGAPINGSGQLGYLPATYVPFGPQPAVAVCFCGPPWQANYTYAVGNVIAPLIASAGESGTGASSVLQVIAASGGTLCSSLPCSGSSQPAAFTSSSLIIPSAAVGVTSCSDSGSSASCVTSTQAFISGGTYPASIVIAGSGTTGYNGTWVLTGATATSVSFTATGLGTCSSSCGTVYQQGSQITDNGLTWQAVANAPNTRGDVVLVNLNPSGAVQVPVAPAPQMLAAVAH